MGLAIGIWYTNGWDRSKGISLCCPKCLVRGCEWRWVIPEEGFQYYRLA